MSLLKSTLLLGSAMGLALSACAGNVVISSNDIHSSYESSQLGFVTRGGEQIPVVIGGKPFGADPKALGDAVLAAMNGSNFGPKVEFAVKPTLPAAQNSRVVMVFNPEQNTDPGQLCRKIPNAGSATGSELRVSAAYCEGSFTLTQANARAKDIDSTQSENFRRMTIQITQALFPPFNPNAPNYSSDSCINC